MQALPFVLRQGKSASAQTAEATPFNERLSKANDLKENTRQICNNTGKKTAHGYLQVWLFKAYATNILPLKSFKVV